MRSLALPFTLSLPHLMAARDFLLPLVVVLALFPLSPTWAAYAIVFGGQAHFFMAYLYQYRGGKMQRLSYILRAILLLALTFWFFAALPQATTLLFLIASNAFALHFAFDEFTLHGEKRSVESWLTIAGFFMVHVWVSLGSVIEESFSSLTLIALVLGATVLALRFLLFKKPLAQAERYVWFVAGIIVFLPLFAPGFLHPYSVIAIVVLLHFLNWMIGYGVRVHKKPIERRYWIETAATTGVSFALLLIFLNVPESGLGVLFSFPAYNAWAIAHIVLSLQFDRA